MKIFRNCCTIFLLELFFSWNAVYANEEVRILLRNMQICFSCSFSQTIAVFTFYDTIIISIQQLYDETWEIHHSKTNIQLQ